MNWLGAMIQKHVKPSDVVLDIGCGIMQATTDVIEKHISTMRDKILQKNTIPANLNCKMIVGIDIWKKYLEKNKHRYVVLNMEVTNTDVFLDKSFDVVLCLDVLEHLERDDGIKLIHEMERIARKKVIIYTPKNFESNVANESDAWGMGTNKYQLHKSLIEPDIFLRYGYEVVFPEPDRNTFAIKNMEIQK